jgi:small subunit ribosomal protein S20
MGRKTRVKNAVKTVRAGVAQNQLETAQTALHKAIPVIQTMSAKGALHWKTAARKISRLTRAVNALATEA